MHPVQAIVYRQHGAANPEEIHWLAACGEKRGAQAKKVRNALDMRRAQASGDPADADMLGTGDEQPYARESVRQSVSDAQQYVATSDLVLMRRSVKTLESGMAVAKLMLNSAHLCNVGSDAV